MPLLKLINLGITFPTNWRHAALPGHTIEVSGDALTLIRSIKAVTSWQHTLCLGHTALAKDCAIELL